MWTEAESPVHEYSTRRRSMFSDLTCRLHVEQSPDNNYSVLHSQLLGWILIGLILEKMYPGELKATTGLMQSQWECNTQSKLEQKAELWCFKTVAFFRTSYSTHCISHFCVCEYVCERESVSVVCWYPAFTTVNCGGTLRRLDLNWMNEEEWKNVSQHLCRMGFDFSEYLKWVLFMPGELCAKCTFGLCSVWVGFRSSASSHWSLLVKWGFMKHRREY